MPKRQSVSRRDFLRTGALGLTTLGAGILLPRPAWAMSDIAGLDSASAAAGDLGIGAALVTIDGRKATATGINGTVPGPLLRWREGDLVDLTVHNALDDASSIHWHGLWLPSDMDGVPGLSFAGIEPGGSYRYRQS